MGNIPIAYIPCGVKSCEHKPVKEDIPGGEKISSSQVRSAFGRIWLNSFSATMEFAGGTGCDVLTEAFIKSLGSVTCLLLALCFTFNLT